MKRVDLTLLLLGSLGAGCFVPSGQVAGGGAGSISDLMCAGVRCAAGQQCCFTTGACFDPADVTACPRPASTSTASATPCASHRDCPAGEFCQSDDRKRCLGPGHCQPTNNCGTCEPPGSERCSTCGCDGITYESTQAACAAGVRIAAPGACGVGVNTGSGPIAIGCGTSAQCGAGNDCCAITGECFNTAEPWRCTPQPDGSVPDCSRNEDCGGGSGGSGGSDRYCAGEGCGTPGTCRSRPTKCIGILEPVCGCDGRTYANECWARGGGTRVRGSTCADGG